jgi:hypothetical protein
MPADLLLLSLIYHHYTHNFVDGIWFLDVLLLFQSDSGLSAPEILAEKAFKYGLGQLSRIFLSMCRNIWPSPPAFEAFYQKVLERMKISAQPSMDDCAVCGYHPLNLAGSPGARLDIVLHSLFLSKWYLEVVSRKQLTNWDYIREYAKFIKRVA